MQPRSIVASISDPEVFAGRLRPGDGRLTTTEKGVFAAEYARVDLDHVWTQSAAERLPRIWEARISGQRHGILLQLAPGPALVSSGAEIDEAKLGLLSTRSPDFCHRLLGDSRWASLSMTPKDWEEYGCAITGHPASFPPFLPVITPASPALERLRRLLRSTYHLAKVTPELMEKPEVERSLDNELIHAAIACVAPANQVRPPTAYRHHAQVIQRFTDLVEENAEAPLYLPQVCLKLGVSARTLRQCCHDYFGMGPKRYLLLHRLHLARRVLLRSAPGKDRVTTVATRFGFWELGRFSVAYHSLFGETPRATLQRPST